jgi:hypothetical protein
MKNGNVHGVSIAFPHDNACLPYSRAMACCFGNRCCLTASWALAEIDPDDTAKKY